MFCSFRAPDAQTVVEMDRASSGSPVCLTCLMAPSISAVILLVAFITMPDSADFVGSQLRRKPVFYFFPAAYSPSSAPPCLGVAGNNRHQDFEVVNEVWFRSPDSDPASTRFRGNSHSFAWRT